MILIPIAMKYRLFGEDSNVYIFRFFLITGLLLIIWQEELRKLIIEDYPDVIEEYPAIKEPLKAHWFTLVIRGEVGDKRLHVEARMHEGATFLSLIWLGVCTAVFF